MVQSLSEMKLIAADVLAERIELVQTIAEQDAEGYEIVKDRLTGEHYIHYYYKQINFAGGEPEMYYQLMPIDHDEVVRLVIERDQYEYPDHWQKPFLRNGPDEQYIWFSPEYADDFAESMRIGKEIEQKLLAFKKSGVTDKEAVEKLLAELDRLRNNE